MAELSAQSQFSLMLMLEALAEMLTESKCGEMMRSMVGK